MQSDNEPLFKFYKDKVVIVIDKNTELLVESKPTWRQLKKLREKREQDEEFDDEG